MPWQLWGIIQVALYCAIVGENIGKTRGIAFIHTVIGDITNRFGVWGMK